MHARKSQSRNVVGTLEDLASRRFKGILARCLIALSATPALAQAQDAAEQAAPAPKGGQDTSEASTANLQTVVVTGTAESRGIKKLDASYSISTASLSEILDAKPSSAADLLKIVPGIWSESSGGEAGANIELAGFPGGSDAPYVTYQLNGAPIFPVPTLSFMDNSALFRIDESIERAEVVQGGPAVVFSNGQIGATANFILRRGTARPRGDIALTAGSEGLYRLDGFYGGPLASDWYVSVGGFYRDSNGIRSPQYPADVGGQITATLAHDWDEGSTLFYGRVLNDKNLFITDVPVSVSPDGMSVSAFPGFNPNSGTFAGNALRGLTVQEFPGSPPGTISADLAKGRGADIHLLGWDLDLQAGPWAVSNRMGYTAGDVPTNALFNNLAPQTLGSFISGEIATANANSNVVAAAGGPATSGTGTLLNGTVVNPNTLVASLGFWVVDKKIQAFTDELRVSRGLFSGNTLTVGTYLASYSSDDIWYLGNNMLVTATPNAQLINVLLNNNVKVTLNGLLSGSTFSLVDHYSGRNGALFVSDQWRYGQWLVDAGYRVENQKIEGTVENTANVNLDNDWTTLYNNSTNVAGGGWTPSTNDQTATSWAVGANYEITPRMSVFGRVNGGYHLPGFDDVRSGTPERQHILNYEVGHRLQTQTVYAVLDVFHRVFSGVPYQQFLADGSQVVASYGARSVGVGFEGRWMPIRELAFDITGDWQHADYTNYTSAAGSSSAAFSYTGKLLQRQPRVQFRFTPEYKFPSDWGAFRVFLTYTYVGLRYSDIGNTQPLPAYNTLDAGAVATLGKNFEIRLQASNLTNEIGLTEGNARVTNSGISNGFEMARPIFGREAQLQLIYKL